jgi:N-ethylmaleimide reductase
MSSPTLFSSLAAGRLQLANRIVMAAMTRSRADDDGLVGPLTAQYYAQRAGAGLMITEGLFPEPMGKGYVRTPGLADERQVQAWRRVTQAVHAAGGRIVAQLMHVGRISDPLLLPGGATPVARPHVTPRALSTAEVRAVVEQFAAGARRAIDAGFDGVELHAGSGYLPMQFLSTGTNQRGDAYGGSAANRARFVIETLEAIVAAIGADRTGLKVTPGKPFNDIRDDDPVATYGTLLAALRPLHIAFLEMAPEPGSAFTHDLARRLFDGSGAYFAGVGFDQRRGAEFIASGRADAIVYGQPFIANPDLPQRFATGAALAQADPATFYAGGARGYVDYPLAPQREAAVAA